MSALDRVLCQRLLAGEQAALDEFFAHHVPRLHRFALRRVGQRADLAEEVVQATIVKAIEKLHTFRGEATLLTWLCTVCRREIEDSRSRVWRKRETPIVGDDQDFRVSAQVEAAAAANNPEAVFLRDESSLRVHEVLDGLAPPYGDILQWKYIDGHSVKEISRRLGVSPKAAESTLTRARVAFRGAFEAEAVQPPEQSEKTAT